VERGKLPLSTYLGCIKTKKWREDLLAKKWLTGNKELGYRRILNHTNN
jgi:hypothetical protein